MENTATHLSEIGYQSVSCASNFLPQDVDSILHSWKEGKYKVLVTTSNVVQGLDYATCRFAVFRWLPRSFGDIIQRCGRDGKPASGFIFWTKHPTYLKISEEAQSTGCWISCPFSSNISTVVWTSLCRMLVAEEKLSCAFSVNKEIPISVHAVTCALDKSLR